MGASDDDEESRDDDEESCDNDEESRKVKRGRWDDDETTMK